MEHRRFIIYCALGACLTAACSDDEAEPTETPSDVGSDSTTPSDDDLPGAVVDYTEERETCDDSNPLRNVYFGDLHAHTRFSFDAYVNQLRLSPDDAYRFARGEEVMIPPVDENGVGTQPIRLDRPLDFVAITDHSEFLAEVQTCITPGLPGYDAPTCERYREGGDNATVRFGIETASSSPHRFDDVCGEDGAACVEMAGTVWGWLQDAAEDAYDRGAACTLTTFPGYEWTATPGVSNYHRNVIFRNADVPELPITYFEASSPLELWQALTTQCLDVGSGCEAISIPHNSNLSDGNMFFVDYPDAETEDEERDQATLRARLEPIAEIFQHKGDSECMNGLHRMPGDTDPLCDFEKLEQPRECLDGTGVGGISGIGCLSRYDYLRYALLVGLQEEERLNVNPYQLGFVASTDTHNAIPGAVSESNYHGHTGNQEDTAEEQLGGGLLIIGGVANNPGGLAAVWAVENSRDAIFDAFQRRETFATSGPRISVRFFGGWGYAEDLCDAEVRVSQGYHGGVSMGGVLPTVPEDGTTPRFLVTASNDPGVDGNPGTQLQQIQIIKGWVNGDGDVTFQVFEVAGDSQNGASVDLDTCALDGPGFDDLCTVWTDPDFDPDRPAYYYARVVENPTCRWSARLCSSLPEDDRPDACEDPESARRSIQERAWTSPIWYRP